MKFQMPTESNENPQGEVTGRIRPAICAVAMARSLIFNYAISLLNEVRAEKTTKT
jgi:hypothetical protein